MIIRAMRELLGKKMVNMPGSIIKREVIAVSAWTVPEGLNRELVSI
jgi:hypothetical protein